MRAHMRVKARPIMPDGSQAGSWTLTLLQQPDRGGAIGAGNFCLTRKASPTDPSVQLNPRDSTVQLNASSLTVWCLMRHVTGPLDFTSRNALNSAYIFFF